MKTISRISVPRRLFGLLVALGLLRLLSLGLYPLTDNTEARYAEIARLMVSSGDWIMPQIAPGVPFWGKPPLSIWLSALSFKFLGVHGFAARLPSFLLSLGVLALVYFLARRVKGSTYALVTTAILATSTVFLVGSGAVMTDPALLLGTTLSMVGFFRALADENLASRVWGYAFFVGLALSLLAKGPVGVVLTMLPVFGWILLQRNWKLTWQRLPWITGALLTLALSLPWYLLAEQHSPGFLEYFLIGEHWKRFVVPGWKGDLYGSAHSHPHGTIWLYGLAAAFPWSFYALVAVVRRTWRQRIFRQLNEEAGFFSYLLLWMLAPLVFFTLAGNVLWTYVLPGMPAFALLCAGCWSSASESTSSGDAKATSLPETGLFSKTVLGMTVLLAVALVVVSLTSLPKLQCQKDMVAAFRDTGSAGARLIYLYDRPYSASFYSRGQALVVKDPFLIFSELESSPQVDFVAVSSRRLSLFPEQMLARFENLGDYNGYTLLREIPQRPPEPDKVTYSR